MVPSRVIAYDIGIDYGPVPGMQKAHRHHHAPHPVPDDALMSTMRPNDQMHLPGLGVPVDPRTGFGSTPS